MLRTRIVILVAIATWLLGMTATVLFLPRGLMAGVEYKMREAGGTNQLLLNTALADHKRREVVRPNVDTLYGAAWLDLSETPLLLEVPAMPNRYYSIQLLARDTSVREVLGTRATGKTAGSFLLSREGIRQCQGQSGHRQIQLPEDGYWLILRVAAMGPDDSEAAGEAARGFSLREFDSC